MIAYSELVLILRLISLGWGMCSLSAERADCSPDLGSSLHNCRTGREKITSIRYNLEVINNFFSFFKLYTTSCTIPILLQPHSVARNQQRPTLALKSASYLVLVPRTQIDNLAELRCADATHGDHNVSIWHLGVAGAVWAREKLQTISANIHYYTLKLEFNHVQTVSPDVGILNVTLSPFTGERDGWEACGRLKKKRSL